MVGGKELVPIADRLPVSGKRKFPNTYRLPLGDMRSETNLLRNNRRLGAHIQYHLSPIAYRLSTYPNAYRQCLIGVIDRITFWLKITKYP